MDEASQQQPGSRFRADQSVPAFVARDAVANARRIAPAAHASSPENAAERAPHPGHGIDPRGLPRNDNTMPTLSIRFSVHPNSTITWKISADSTLLVCHERIWLTRVRSPYDHWLGSGDTIRLQRGERIWLSTDADEPARVSLTSAWSRRRSTALHWVEWLAAWPAALMWRRAR
ncbi:DUF2917 domain-containing protein [Paraburkholderia caballeronis]|uniref:DUF2917 domain-containing protein n=1 Tax=Paraburkholderia caballeronis TaxID=416943 RepID=UPI0010DDFABF|nr:DUF2917 domain-containing protein [Paraburkholderia caballeronis]TDV15093.1 hypothetical protein C7408_107205 [Paraburkholderia caballeronis]TDV16782.1 hypothetical protein C7406_10743 [Paraburkholderia caballeronis]TDV25829.1 hypothetical protein C7404_107205 [Paraburkholderia caballeronis]TDV34467.1 hypothetical protein C7405_108198 [Paraburkholderia caballeronis]